MKIKDVFYENGIEITEKQEADLNAYYELIIETNKIHNLTAITEYDEVVIKHFLDCAVVCKKLSQGATLCDIGAGAGFPSIVIKIVRPDIDILMVDSLNKRVNFLNEAIEKLALTKIKTIHARAEDLGNNYKNSFDYVVARAVAPLVTLVEYCIPYVKVGGEFIAMKSIETEKELFEAEKAIILLGGKTKEITEINLVGTALTRKLIIIGKKKPTMEIYPRGQNLPRIKPLI